MRLATAVIATSLMLPTAGHALEWSLGPAYASGIGEVTDLYERNLRREGFDAEVDLEFPIGLSVSFHYDWGGNVRGDLGFGPMFFISGDVDHFELPVTATIGYEFGRDGEMSPYVRGGLAYHYASGDYYESSSPGLLAAVGLDFDRFAIDLALDNAELEFESVECAAAGQPCTSGTEKLNTYEFVLTFLWKFY